MNQTILKTKFVTVIAVIICYSQYLLGYFQILMGTFVVLIASLIEFRKDIFKSLSFQKKGLNIKYLLLIAPLIS
jgi:hypothetical protein